MMNTIINFFKESKLNKKKISVVTCYDYSFSKLISETEIDSILVGDSLGMVIQGHNSTLPVTLDEIIYHTKAVKKGSGKKWVIADLPFLSYQVSVESCIFSSGRILKETDADAVKLEGATEEILESIFKLQKMGVPVMGHLGLTPQSFQVLGGYKVQGKNEKQSKEILEDAKKLEQAGVFSIVLEMLPESLGDKISNELKIPTIGIGAGKFTDGQVLVLQDLLGMNENFSPKFLKKFANLSSEIKNSLNEYNHEVKENTFPSKENSF
jgi:3-methyl-2-oxobutanoate hydroxymethyltransferase